MVRSILYTLFLLLLAALPAQAAYVSIGLDSTSYGSDASSMELNVDIYASGSEVADIYLALVEADGSIRCLGPTASFGGRGEIGAFLPGWTVANLSLHPALALPIPADLATGNHALYLVLCQAGTQVMDMANWLGYGVVAFSKRAGTSHPNLSLLGEIAMPGTHTKLVFSPDGSTIYTNSRQVDSSGVVFPLPVIDAASATISRTWSSSYDVRGGYLNETGSTLYYEGWDLTSRSNIFTKFDSATGSVAGTVSSDSFNGIVFGDGQRCFLSGQSDKWVDVNPLWTRRYSVDSSTNTASVASLDTNGTAGQTIASVPVVTRPTSISVSPSGDKLYVLSNPSDGIYVTVIDTASFTVETTLTIGYSGAAFPVGIAVGGDGTAYVAYTYSLYVNMEDYTSVHIVAIDGTDNSTRDVVNFSATSRTNAPSQIYGMAVSPDGNRLAATAYTEQGYVVWVFDTMR